MGTIDPSASEEEYTESDSEYEYIDKYRPQKHDAHLIDIDELWEKVVHKKTRHKLRESLEKIVEGLFLSPPSQSQIPDMASLTLLSSGSMTNVFRFTEQPDRVLRISRRRITKSGDIYILCKLVLEIILMKYMHRYMPRHVPDVHSFGFLESGKFYAEVDRVKDFEHREEDEFSPFQKATKQYIVSFLHHFGLSMLDFNSPSNWACKGELDLFVLDLNDVDVMIK